LDVFVKGEGLDKTVADKLKVGTDIVLTFAQHAIADKTSEGEVFYGSLPEWIYIVQDGQVVDLQGNPSIPDHS